MIFGILSGLGAATAQSLSYLSMRHYVQKREGMASRQLLVLGHVWMGIFSIVLLPIAMTTWGLRWDLILWPLVWSTVFYGAGQISLAMALRYAEASRVSPLMTMKLIVTGMMASILGLPLGGESVWITPWQWVAVILCVVAGISINFTGGRMKRRALVAVGVTSVAFSLSDWNVNLLIKGFLLSPGMDKLHASLAAEAFCYLLTGLLVLPLLKNMGSRKGQDWKEAAPFGVAWFVAMIFLFLAFSSVGVLLGSILQCTRGFITILLASVLMYRGHAHIEPMQTHGVIVRRLAAGLLMFGGITLYVLSGPSNTKMQTPAGSQPRSEVCPTTPTMICSRTALCAKRV